MVLIHESALMRIFLTTTEPEDPLVKRLLPQMRAALAALEPRYSLADTESHAEAILFVESGRNKFASYRKVLLDRPEIGEHPDKCFVYDFTDRPASFLPGLYTAMPERRFDVSSMCAIPGSWDDTPDSVFDEAIARNWAELLFSFRGFRSAPVRTRLFSASFDRGRCSITETHDWWNFEPAAQARRDYLAEIRSTLFPLAPRGLGTTTLRLYEIMRLGRAPVILSDDWVPPGGIPWNEFSIRVAERRVADLPKILTALEPWAGEMGENARAAWERWCRPGAPLMRYLAQRLESIILLRGPDFDGQAMKEQWSQQRFMWQHGWHPVQRLTRSIRAGTLHGDLRRTRRRAGSVEGVTQHDQT
jgi:hypothetical protein